MTILLLIIFVVNGDLDYSYRIQDTLEVCEVRKSKVLEHISIYGNVDHIEAHCIELGSK